MNVRESDRESYAGVYDIGILNVIFAVCSVVLFFSIIWLILDDYSRQWKRIQRGYQNIDLNLTRKQMEAALPADEQTRLQELRQQIEQIEQALQNNDQYHQLLNRLDDFTNQLQKIDADVRLVKSVYDAERYAFEEYALHHSGEEVEARRQALAARAVARDSLQTLLENLQYQRDQAQQQAQKLQQQKNELRDQMEQRTKEYLHLQAKAERLEPGLLSFILNAPLVDFMDPTLEIKQVVLNDMIQDINFATVPRVDRCMTCHLGIESRAYAQQPQPYTAHPRLDLFVNVSSPHPVARFGCTICHNGRDRGVDFFSTFHYPQGKAQQVAWQEKYQWKPMHYWDEPMFPKRYTEASCYKCHADQVEVPAAPNLNKGLTLIRELGCYGCHKIKGFNDLRKAGPTLKTLATKLDKEWTIRWVENPQAFRHNKMPVFFNQSNTDTPDDLVRNDVEVRAIVEYLYGQSEAPRYNPSPLKGEAERGKNLVDSIGCLACHVTDDIPFEQMDRSHPRRFGPGLAATGSKLSAAWIYNWIKNPKRIWPETTMPDLRLTDREAADITAYLLTLKNESFIQMEPASVDAAILDEITLKYLRRDMIKPEAEQKLTTMNQQEKLVFSGKHVIQKYGCFGCHEIGGFEKARPIGIELSEEGSKLVARLDFGLLEALPETRHDWFFQKLKEPRIFDRGKVKSPDEKLKMPNFNFTDDEAHAVVTAILGFVKQQLPVQSRRQLGPQESLVEQGREIIRQYNCRGCHRVDGSGEAIAETMPEADPGLLPPLLDGEGAKVQTAWLNRFLQVPYTIRSWLNIRMPTFDFTDQQLNTLLAYFAYKDQVRFPFEAPAPKASAELFTAGRLLFQQLQCLKCHPRGKDISGLSASILAPDLGLAKERLRSAWMVDWLRDPQVLKPGTQMPTYFPEGMSPLPDLLDGDIERQMLALRAYMLTL